MMDLDSRFRSADGIDVPDRWPDIESRQPNEPGPSPSRRWATVVVALLVSMTTVSLLVVAFSRPEGISTNEAPMSASNGPIWAIGAGGEAGSLIYAIDPTTGRNVALWSDGRNPDFPNFPVELDHIAANYDYAFSPDGSQVAFSRWVKGERSQDCCIELFVMNSDGSNLRQLTHDGAFASYPSWSPDGSQLVFSSYRGPNYVPGCPLTQSCPADLFVIGSDGTSEHQLTAGAADGATPTWAPSGDTIAYVRSDGSGLGSIWTVNADGSGAQDLVASGGTIAFFPQWSPDGSQIAYLGSQLGERLGVWIANADGANAHEVVDTRADTTFGRPVWSPDGTAIAYSDLSTGESQLWVIRADGSDPHRVANFPRYGISPIAWQPVLATSSPDASTVNVTNAAHSYSVDLPSGWTVADRNLTPWLSSPSEIFSAGTFEMPVSNDPGDELRIFDAPVAPRALAAMTATDAFVSVQESPGPVSVTDDRPATFQGAAHPCCSAQTGDYPFTWWWVPFIDQGRAFYLFVAIGKDASTATADQAWSIADSLSFVGV